MFNVGDILELKMDLILYNKGLTVKIIELIREDYGKVEIIGTKGQDSLLGKEKNADLTLFKLVRKSGFLV